MMPRPWNFSAGPAVLPESVLAEVGAELTDWHGSGLSVMEMSHRGKAFTRIIDQAEADLRDLLGIPGNYRVLFLQGGATLQFAMVPLNLLRGRRADYVVTGAWSAKAAKEATRLGAVRVLADTVATGYDRFPVSLPVAPDAAYLHVCTNETIHGVECLDLPDTGAVPLVADMSSHILSRPINVSRFGLIYAGAQKNIAPAGLTLVIVRDDLLGQVMPGMPTLLDYRIHADNGSMLNTPPTFAIYVAGLVLQWLKARGGLPAMAAENIAKADHLYAAIDASNGFYRNPVQPAFRSRMNVPFTLARPELDAVFLQAAEQRGFVGLKGHQSVGGMRASIYNAMPLAGVESLVRFMTEFAAEHA